MSTIFPLVSAFGFLMPIIVAVVWTVKAKGRKAPIFVGVLMFYVFVNMIEKMFHAAFLLSGNGISQFLTSNPIAYALYGGLAAGLCEESGRLVGFKFLLKNYERPENAVSYGIGHAGFECMSILGVGYLVHTLTWFAMGTDVEEGFAVLIPAMQAIADAPWIAGMAALERVFAMIMHISLSVLVFIAARDDSRNKLFVLAIALHALVNFPAGLYQMGVLPLAVTEVLVGIFSIGVAVFARKLYKEYKTEYELLNALEEEDDDDSDLDLDMDD